MASLILQIVWMAMNRARTLGTHFGNNRLQAELLEDIRELLGEARGYRFRGERRDLNRNPGRFPVRRRFGGNRHGAIRGSARGATVEGTDSTGASSAGPRLAGSTPASVPAPRRRPVPTTATIHGGQPMAVTGHRAAVADSVPDADAVF
jgi:hypothetical protein